VEACSLSGARNINKNPPAISVDPAANLKDFVNHIEYTVKLIGMDLVGPERPQDTASAEAMDEFIERRCPKSAKYLIRKRDGN